MLVMTKVLLEKACAENYAVAAVNITNSVEAEAAVTAGEALKAPLIFDVLPEDMKIPYPKAFICWLRERCRYAEVPISINVDYGGSFAGAVQKIQYGATSINTNCSALSFEENAVRVKPIAELAHAAGIACGAELGSGGDGGLTDPCQAADFIQLTEIDWLTVSVGTTPQPNSGAEPHVDFQRLSAIKQAVGDFPLGLHGCAGTPLEELAKACRLGLNKINIASDLRRAMMQEVLDSGGTGHIMEHAAKGYQKKLMEMICICGSEGRLQ